jgi:hypothetical protein
MLKTVEERERAQQEMRDRIAAKKVADHEASVRRTARKRGFKAREVKRVQAWRKRKKAQARAARHLEIVAEKAARAQRRAVREEKKACDMRKHATAQAGFVAGWSAEVPQTDDELKALSWAKRYRESYAHGAAEKRRCQELVESTTRTGELNEST